MSSKKPCKFHDIIDELKEEEPSITDLVVGWRDASGMINYRIMDGSCLLRIQSLLSVAKEGVLPNMFGIAMVSGNAIKIDRFGDSSEMQQILQNLKEFGQFTREEFPGEEEEDEEFDDDSDDDDDGGYSGEGLL